MRRKYRISVFRRAARLLGSRLFHWAENNDCCDARKNSELWFINDRLSRHRSRKERRPMVVIDAGAHIGDYSHMLSAAAHAVDCPLMVHAFEPSRDTRARLQARFAGAPWLQVAPFALGAECRLAFLHSPAAGSTLASLVPRPGASPSTQAGEKVEVTALASYLSEKRIEHVDLLKLDVEGYEFAALLGLGDWLNPERVSAIQFEYGGTTLDAGDTLRRSYDLLTAHGYQVAKLMPRSLMVRNYAPWMEHFHYANYVAIGDEERV
jgi:FkbM family methyltransferase